jgi:multisubunit Na+/H+ antiporter MnhG subunit
VSWQAVIAVVLLIAGGLLELIAVLGICVMRDPTTACTTSGWPASGRSS